jgi:hypothetical protein
MASAKELFHSVASLFNKLVNQRQKALRRYYYGHWNSPVNNLSPHPVHTRRRHLPGVVLGDEKRAFLNNLETTFAAKLKALGVWSTNG